MTYDEESDLHYVTTLHDQELMVSRNRCNCGHCKLRVCIWVAEPGEDDERPLVFRCDEDALLIAKQLLEAVLSPDEATMHDVTP